MFDENKGLKTLAGAGIILEPWLQVVIRRIGVELKPKMPRSHDDRNSSTNGNGIRVFIVSLGAGSVVTDCYLDLLVLLGC